jgi:hypothetical protein
VLSFAEASVKKDLCTHPGSFGDMCILCGQRLAEESGVTFGYIHKVYFFKMTDWLNFEFFGYLCWILKENICNTFETSYIEGISCDLSFHKLLIPLYEAVL